MNTLNDNIVIKKINEEIKTSSGLVVSDSDMASMRYYRGIIMMDNPDYTKVKKGDIIYYDKVAGQPFIFNGEPCLIIRTSDIKIVE